MAGIADGLKRGISLTLGAFNSGMKGGKGNFIEVLKYRVVSFFAMIAGYGLGAACVLVLVFALRGVLGNEMVLVLSVLLGIGGIVLGNTYYNAANFGAIEYAYSGERVGYFEGKNVRVAFKWALFKIAAVALLAIPFGIIAAGGILLLGKEAAVDVVSTIAILLLAPIGLLLYYLNQEFAIKKRGPVDAIRASVGILKKNFWETALAASLLAAGTNIAYAVPLGILYLGAGISALLMLGGGETYALGAALAVCCIIGITAVLTLVESGLLIVQVGLYKGVIGAKKKKAA